MKWGSCRKIRQTLVPRGFRVPSPFHVKQEGTLCVELIWQCEAQPQLCSNFQNTSVESHLFAKKGCHSSQKHLVQTNSVLALSARTNSDSVSCLFFSSQTNPSIIPRKHSGQ